MQKVEIKLVSFVDHTPLWTWDQTPSDLVSAPSARRLNDELDVNHS